MSKNVKISAALVALFVAALAVFALAGGSGDEEPVADTPAAAKTPSSTPTNTSPDGAGATVVRKSDARQLGPKGSSGVTFTEFLDFECESCAAAFPVIEQLRTQYAGRVTFNLRYFPIEHHKNAVNAALAVEAAHQQGKLEAMYQRMYETQLQWGEQQDSKASVFRGFAKDLALDMKAYDADVASAKTKARVEQDVEAGAALGVQGTPTFFIGEQRIEPQSLEDLRAKLDAAVQAAS